MLTSLKGVFGLEPPTLVLSRAKDHHEPGSIREQRCRKGGGPWGAFTTQLCVMLVVRVSRLLPAQVHLQVPVRAVSAVLLNEKKMQYRNCCVMLRPIRSWTNKLKRTANRVHSID